MALDGVGFVPGWVGFAASGLNALWYASEGRGGEATLSAASGIPVGKALKGLTDLEAAASDARAASRTSPSGVGDGWPARPDPLAVGHAAGHAAPWAVRSKSQFFDGVDLDGLSDTTHVTGYLQDNGNTRYLTRAPHEVGVDRTTGVATCTYTVIRRPDGTVLTMFPGASPRS